MRGLKIQRILAGMTQQQLADATGISLRRIQSYEQGDRSPRADALQQLADYFGCAAEQLK